MEVKTKLLDAALVSRAARKLRALDHPIRKKIIQAIVSRHEITVTELYIALRREQSVISQHLAILRRNKFVKYRRDGKNIIYRINYREIEQTTNIVKQLAAFFISK